MPLAAEIGNTGVVKSHRRTLRPAPGRPKAVACRPATGRTRAAVARLLMEQGPVTAAAVAAALELSGPAVRRHLDALIADGEAEVRDAPRRGPPRPRPSGAAATCSPTPAGPGSATATTTSPSSALRYLAEHGGPDAVEGFAAQPGRATCSVRRRRAGRAPPTAPGSRAGVLAGVLTARGYAAQAREAGSGGTGRPAVPAPLPGRPRRRRVPGAVRGRDPRLRRAARHARAAAGHHRPRRRRVHHPRSAGGIPDARREHDTTTTRPEREAVRHDDRS